jgi:hypothetical protein
MFKRRRQNNEVKRNRPQIEQGSRKVFSYYASRDSSESMRQQRYQTESSRRGVLGGSMLRRLPVSSKFLILVVVPAAVIALFYNTFLSTTAQMVITGDPEKRMLLKDPSDYAEASEKALKASALNRSKFTFDSGKVEQAISKQFPELAETNVTIPFIGNSPVVKLVPAEPAALLVARDGRSFVVDRWGRIISSDVGSAPKGLVMILDQSGITSKVGDKILPSDDMRFIRSVNHQLQAKKLSVTSVSLPAAGRQADVRLAGKPFYVKFSLAGDVLQQTGAYLSVQQKLDKEKKTPSEYIDVRVGDRVYYK